MVTRTYQIWMQPKVGGCNFPLFYLKSFSFFLKKRVAKNKRMDAWQIVRDVPRRSMEDVLVLVVDIYPRLSYFFLSLSFFFFFIFCIVLLLWLYPSGWITTTTTTYEEERRRRRKKTKQWGDRNGLESYRYRKPIDKSHLQSMTHYEGGGTSSSSSSLFEEGTRRGSFTATHTASLPSPRAIHTLSQLLVLLIWSMKATSILPATTKRL